MFCPECDSNKILVLSYDNRRAICPECVAIFEEEYYGEWKRDYYAEREWEKMASYVNKTYEQVFRDEYNSQAQSVKNASA